MSSIQLKARGGKPGKKSIAEMEGKKKQVPRSGKLTRNEYHMYLKDLREAEDKMKKVEDLAESIAEMASRFEKRVLMEPESPLNQILKRIMATAIKSLEITHVQLSEAPETIRPFLLKNKPGFLKRLFG